MENNIFLQNKKKFNPDIFQKLNNKETERKSAKFNIENKIYNPITNIIPDKVTKQSDLEIKFNNNINLKERMADLERSRSMQDIQYKPLQLKTIPDKTVSNVDDFVNLKSNAVKKPIDNNNYNNVLENLKDLGII
jgi:hypothetical protein